MGQVRDIAETYQGKAMVSVKDFTTAMKQAKARLEAKAKAQALAKDLGSTLKKAKAQARFEA